jgi:hypothetical protein
MATKITRDQFVIKENEVVHTPTGARFIAEPNDGHAVQVIWGGTGDRLDTGDDYQPENVEEVAAQLLMERMQSLV